MCAAASHDRGTCSRCSPEGRYTGLLLRDAELVLKSIRNGARLPRESRHGVASAPVVGQRQFRSN